MAALEIHISTHELFKKDEYLNSEESTDYSGLENTTTAVSRDLSADQL